MNLATAIGAVLLGVGAALFVIAPARSPVVDELDGEPEEMWVTTNPLPPTDCDLCGGGREVWVDDYLAVPCKWCAHGDRGARRA